MGGIGEPSHLRTWLSSSGRFPVDGKVNTLSSKQSLDAVDVSVLLTGESPTSAV